MQPPEDGHPWPVIRARHPPPPFLMPRRRRLSEPGTRARSCYTLLYKEKKQKTGNAGTGAWLLFFVASTTEQKKRP
jgi:hypothetical protein